MGTRRTNLGVGRRAVPPSRRGSIYVMVLMVSLIVLVIGLGSVMVSRSAARSTMGTADWSEAGIAAQSGVEYALAVMNSSSSWRTDTTSGSVIAAPDVGRAKVRVSVVDETDGNLSNNPGDSARVYGAATVGTTSRAYSVLATTSGSAGLDVLRCAVYSAGNLTTTGDKTLTGGPFSCAGTMNNSTTIVGNVEAGAYTSSGSTLGYVQTGMTAKTMPGNSAWTTLSAIATTIPWASTGGNIDKEVLTATLNTFGTVTNPSGVYAINVPALSTLTIHRSRFQATLLITLSASASLVIKDENLWDPADASKPMLMVQGSLLSSVEISGGAATLAESAGRNYNPALAPYGGVTDADTTDSYPSELHGVIHILTATPVAIKDKTVFVGSLITAGDVTIDKLCTLSANPALKSAPPQGYTDPASYKMSPVPGTYKWEVADVNPAG